MRGVKTPQGLNGNLNIRAAIWTDFCLAAEDFWSIFLISLLSTSLSIIAASVVLVQADHTLIYAPFNANIYASVLGPSSNFSIWTALCDPSRACERWRPRQCKHAWNPLRGKLPGLETNARTTLMLKECKQVHIHDTKSQLWRNFFPLKLLWFQPDVKYF